MTTIPNNDIVSTGTGVRSKDLPSPFFCAARLSSVGMEMAISILLGWRGGYWLDEKFDTGPYLMLGGLLLGVAAGFKALIRTATHVNSQHRNSKALPMRTAQKPVSGFGNRVEGGLK